MNLRQLIIVIAAIGLIVRFGIVAYGGERWDQSTGWDQEKGFSTASIPLDAQHWRETQWSAWLAVQAGLQPERDCEVRTAYQTRVDILTETESLEVEWSEKWAESIAQSVQYATQTHRSPAIILLSHGDDLQERLECLAVCNKLGINLYIQRVVKSAGTKTGEQ